MKIKIKTLFKPLLKTLKMKSIIYFDRMLLLINFKSVTRQKVIFISEKNDWAIKIVGKNITYKINKKKIGFMQLTSSPKYFQDKVIHFGSQYMWVDWWKNLPKNNKYIVSFFHGKNEDGEDVKHHISKFLESLSHIDIIIVSNTIVKKRLISWGVSPKKIKLIPIGIDNAYFKPTNIQQKYKIRSKLGIKRKSIVIGSFQKDGIGWEKGELPKLIKGPDIFVNVIKSLKEQGYDILIFLTGPARGYIKRELEKIDVKYVHKFFKNQKDLLTCYHALDLYLITSREEGGPMGLMESMACGIPVVSSPVGMSVDLIKNKSSGMLSHNFEFKHISKLIVEVIENKKLRSRIINNGLLLVDEVNWENVSRMHYEDAYLPLIEN